MVKRVRKVSVVKQVGGRHVKAEGKVKRVVKRRPRGARSEPEVVDADEAPRMRDIGADVGSGEGEVSTGEGAGDASGVLRTLRAEGSQGAAVSKRQGVIEEPAGSYAGRSDYGTESDAPAVAAAKARGVVVEGGRTFPVKRSGVVREASLEEKARLRQERDLAARAPGDETPEQKATRVRETQERLREDTKKRALQTSKLSKGR